MRAFAQRIGSSQELGRAHRWFDFLLGSSAIVPLVGCAGAPWVLPTAPALVVRTLAVIWSSTLLGFFAGVRRGLTFSEAGGGRPAELATMLGLYFIGVVAMVFCSPALAAVGIALVGVLDAVSGARGEAPRYFSQFRPVQMAIGTAALLVVQAKVG